MEASIYALLSVLLVSAVSLIGVITLSLNKEKLEKVLFVLVSFSVGALFGDAFIHLLPEAFLELGIEISTSLYVLLGILIFFVLEKFIRWRHCHISESEDHVHPMATVNLVGDGVHNFIDGLLIGASYIVSIPVGVATTIAVVLHEIPSEIGDFGVLLHSGLTRRKALLYNFLSASLAILGAVVSLLLGSSLEGYSSILLPITAGGFLYIAGSDLIPELHHETRVEISVLQFLSILVGIGIMALLTLLK